MNTNVLELIFQSPLFLILGTVIFESLLVAFLPKERAERLVDFLERMLKLFPFTAIITAFKGKERKEPESAKERILESAKVA